MADSYRPRNQPVSYPVPLFTFDDAVEQVIDAFKSTGGDYQLRQARRAVIDAYRDFPQRANWHYFKRRYQFSTVAKQTTGSVEYDHAGGTYERQLTLTGATWPANTWEYLVQIGNVQYGIEDRKSDTVITLQENRNPGSDVASGTAYILSKPFYPLPTDFRFGGSILELNGGSIEPVYASFKSVLDANYAFSSPQFPYRYTIVNDGSYYGSLGIMFGPPPGTAITFDAVYSIVPRPLFYQKYSAGTVGVSSTTVTGSGTAFDARMVGSIIRFPDSTNPDEVPTGIAGAVDGTHNPYVEERTITAVASTTLLTIDAALSETISGSKYVISDPVDIHEQSMRSAFLRMAESYYAMYANKQGERGFRKGIADQALLFAKENASYYRGEYENESPLNYSVTIDTSTE